MARDWSKIALQHAECSSEHCNDPECPYIHCDLYWVGELPFFHREAAEMTLRDMLHSTEH